MVNQILTRQELMLSFLLQALVHMEFKEDHEQYVNQVTHAGEEKEQLSTESSSDEGATMYNVLSSMSS